MYPLTISTCICALVYHDFKYTCLWHNWRHFNPLIYDKEPKKLFLEVKLFWYKNKIIYVKMLWFIYCHWYKSLTAQLLRDPTGGLSIRTYERATMAKGHLDYKYWKFGKIIQEFQSEQVTLCWPKQFSKDLETFAPAVAKVTLWSAVVLNHAMVPGVITSGAA